MMAMEEQISAIEVALGVDEDMTAEEKKAAKLGELGRELQAKISQRVQDRVHIEQRMIEDLRAYRGVYDTEIQEQLNKLEYGSKLFYKLTRSRTNMYEARLSDMLTPHNEDNFQVDSTPVPEMAQKMTDTTPVPEGGVTENGEQITEGMVAQEVIGRAKAAAAKMQRRISDQLTEARWHPTLRGVLHNMCKLGTGVLKGPMVEERIRRAWIPVRSGGKVDRFDLSVKRDLRPTCENVHPFHFFPDLSVTRVEDMEDIFERHMMTSKQVRKLARLPGFMKSQIKKVLEMDPSDYADPDDTYLAELQSLGDNTVLLGSNRYRVWEYYGPLEKEWLEEAGMKDIDIEDSMQQFDGVVWFCNGVVLKVGINLLDSGDFPYSMAVFEQDETSPFGFGVPRLIRDPQAMSNASLRMMMDNSGLASGPQIIMRKEAVYPHDGKWAVSPRKLWISKDKDTSIRDVFHTVNIDAHIPELQSIFNMARQMADEEINLPPLMQTSPDAKTTFSGLAMATNQANISLRIIVKNVDDELITPFITRMYDYNMQFNKDQSIKGDYEVKATGSNILMAREVQAQSLASLLPFVGHEKFGPWIKEEKLFKATVKASHVDTDEFLRSEDEHKAYMQEIQQQQQGQTDPETARAQTMLQIEQMRQQTKAQELQAQLQMAEMKKEVELLKLEQQGQLTREKVEAEMRSTRESNNLKRIQHVTELQYAKETGKGI